MIDVNIVLGNGAVSVGVSKIKGTRTAPNGDKEEIIVPKLIFSELSNYLPIGTDLDKSNIETKNKISVVVACDKSLDVLQICIDKMRDILNNEDI